MWRYLFFVNAMAGFSTVQASLLDQFLQLVQHTEGWQDNAAAEWRNALQIYGLPRPDRSGWFVIYRAMPQRVVPGMPGFLTIPVHRATSVHQLIGAIEGGWSDLYSPGRVIPWRVSVVDTYRARSHNRLLESPTMILVPMNSYADFEQRPHGVLEVVFPHLVHTFGTILPQRINWPILRNFLVPLLPIGLGLHRVEMWYNDQLVTEELVDCNSGFFVQVSIAIGTLPMNYFFPAQDMWTPLLHVQWMGLPAGMHLIQVHVPGGTALGYSTTIQAVGISTRWEDWLPQFIHQSPFWGSQMTFTVQEVQRASRVEAPVCMRRSRHVVLIPTVGMDTFPIVVFVSINCPSTIVYGAVFTPAMMNLSGVLELLEISSMCTNLQDEPCVCYHNGRLMTEQDEHFTHADFLSCYQGRSYTMQQDEVLSISDCEIHEDLTSD